MQLANIILGVKYYMFLLLQRLRTLVMILRSLDLLHIQSLHIGVFSPLLEYIHLLAGTSGCFVAFGVDICLECPQMLLPSLVFGCPHAVCSSVLHNPIAKVTALFTILSTETCLCISLRKTFMNYLHWVVCAGKQSLDRRIFIAVEAYY